MRIIGGSAVMEDARMSSGWKRISAAIALAAATYAAMGGWVGARAQESLIANGNAGRPDRGDVIRTDLSTNSVQDFVRIDGQGRSKLRGIGLVVGLNGTGDAGSELALARPLAELYKKNGLPVPDLSELENARQAALVWISCTIGEHGARRDDVIDVQVNAMHSAKSLRGGRLVLAPMMGPLPGQGVFAIAEGAVSLESEDHPTAGVVRGGAQMVEDIRMPAIREGFDLIINEYYRSWTTARTLTSQINGAMAELDSDDLTGAARPVAFAVDEMTVRVVIPSEERKSPANFIAGVMGTRFSPSLLDLPAMVVVNERTGSIVVTRDVQISPVTVGNERLTVTTTTPTTTPTAADPLIESTNWASVSTTGRTGDTARINDLLTAFKQLDVPIRDQIHILREIHRAGSLHAKLIIE